MALRRATFVLVACLALTAFAQDDEETQRAEPARGAPRTSQASPFVHTSSVFVNANGAAVPIGETTRVVMGLVNSGNNDVNVTGIRCSLTNQYKAVQNFTGKAIGDVVPGGSEGSFEYEFEPSPFLEPMDYHLTCMVYYEDSDEGFISAFMDADVTLVDNSPVIDFRTALQYVLFISVAAVVAFVLVKSSSGSSRGGSSIERGTATESGSFAEDFLKRNAVSGGRVGKSARRRRMATRKAERAGDSGYGSTE